MNAAVLQVTRSALVEEMATHCSILAWRIPWTEEPEGLQCMGLPGVRHDRATEHIQDQYADRSCILCTSNEQTEKEI